MLDITTYVAVEHSLPFIHCSPKLWRKGLILQYFNLLVMLKMCEDKVD